jgi:SHAQKYF class myb-like DNA-binding protein
MVSLNPNPPEGFYLDPMGMALPNLGSFSTPATASTTSSSADDPSKKIRKPYTITKSRESWTEPEHDKFLEALQLFDRDWKKIEAFIGSKTVIQIRSHAQKYFLKVQKSGTNEHLPPPRPKRKAAHPYPQKASKNVPPVLTAGGDIRNPSDSINLKVTNRTATAAVSSSRTETLVVGLAKGAVDTRPSGANNSCSSTESTPRTTRSRPEINDHRNFGSSLRVLPDFSQVYGFIGSVFDPNASDQLRNLKKMDPIDVETILLLMKNLSVNLTSPDFEDHRKLLSSYEIDSEKENLDDINAFLDT